MTRYHWPTATLAVAAGVFIATLSGAPSIADVSTAGLFEQSWASRKERTEQFLHFVVGQAKKEHRSAPELELLDKAVKNNEIPTPAHVHEALSEFSLIVPQLFGTMPVAFHEIFDMHLQQLITRQPKSASYAAKQRDVQDACEAAMDCAFETVKKRLNDLGLTTKNGPTAINEEDVLLAHDYSGITRAPARTITMGSLDTGLGVTILGGDSVNLNTGACTGTVNIATDDRYAKVVNIGNTDASTIVTVSGRKVYVGDSTDASATVTLNSTHVYLKANPTTKMEAATKDYVDTADANYVVGPASSTQYALARYADTTGKLLANSAYSTIDNSGNILLNNNATTATTGIATGNTTGAVNIATDNATKDVNIVTGTTASAVDIATGGAHTLTMGYSTATVNITGTTGIAGATTINSTGAFAVNLNTGDSTGAVNIATNNAVKDVNIVTGTTASTVDIATGGAHTLTMGHSTATVNVTGTTGIAGATTINNTGAFAVNLNTGDSTGAVNIATDNAVKDVNIVTGTTASTVDIATGGAHTLTMGNSAATVNVTGTTGIAGATTINSSGAFGVNINTGTSTGAVTIGNAANSTDVRLPSVYNRTVGSATLSVIVDSDGKLGTAASSRRYKENIQPIEHEAEKILQLQPVTFNYKVHPVTAKQYGLIAEDVDKVLPEIVIYKDGQPETVQYQQLPALLLRQIQLQHGSITELAKKFEVVSKQLKLLKKRTQKLEHRAVRNR